MALPAEGALLLVACSDGDDQADEGSSDLIGKATGSNVTWNPSDVITTTFGGGIEMTYAATDTTIELRNESGGIAYPFGQVGVSRAGRRETRAFSDPSGIGTGVVALPAQKHAMAESASILLGRDYSPCRISRCLTRTVRLSISIARASLSAGCGHVGRRH